MRYFVSAGVVGALIGAAEAAPKCPPGQIYRVTKQVCVDKATAIQDGIIIARPKPTRAAAKTAPVEKPLVEKPVATEQGGANEARLTGAIPQAPARILTGRSTSPFGSLFDPWAGNVENNQSDRGFSLRLMAGD